MALLNIGFNVPWYDIPSHWNFLAMIWRVLPHWICLAMIQHSFVYMEIQTQNHKPYILMIMNHMISLCSSISPFCSLLPTENDVSQITSHQVFWPYLQLMRCAGFKIIFSRSGGRWREVVFAQDKEWWYIYLLNFVIVCRYFLPPYPSPPLFYD